jgi:signal transduction histidine kinase/CheY-like chemotaxis protein
MAEDGLNKTLKNRKTGASDTSRRLILVLFILSFGIVLLVSFGVNSLMDFFLHTMEDNIEMRLITTAERLAELVKAEELDQFREIEDMAAPSYQALRERLVEFAGKTGVLYAYYIRPLGNSVTYIIDNDYNEKTHVGLHTPPFSLKEDPWLEASLDGQSICAGLGNYSHGWDGLLTAYAPMRGSDGEITAIAGVDIIDEDIVNGRRMVAILTAVQIVMVAVVFLSGVLCLVRYRKAAKAAEKAHAYKSSFLANLSHEIRTPMNAIIGMTVIAKNTPDPERVNSMLDGIEDASKHLLAVINDILDISKIEAGNFELVPVEYDTAALVSDTVNLNMVHSGSKPINFVLEIGGGFPAKLTGDDLRVKQILNNLLSNAFKYTEKGTVTLNVECAHLEENKVALSFTVSDSGIGIRPEDMEKLFADYVQLDAKANRKVEGTGLGLAIAKNLVEMMSGTITAESEYGKGSVFTARIIQEQTADAVIGEETAEALRNFCYASDNKKQAVQYSYLPDKSVLAVDDKPVNLLVTKGLLKLYGLRVDTASSGREAVEKARAGRYDIIFMDHMMPEMDGIEAAEIIRGIDGFNTPIVALTANALPGAGEYYLQKGFQDYISKPIDQKALDEVIKKWIPADQNPQPVNFILEMNARRLDKLNHIRAAFEIGGEIDAEYFSKIAALIESFPALHSPLREQAALLVSAARKKDAQKIRETLPVFCGELNLHIQDSQHGTESEIVGEILHRLKETIQNGDSKTTGKIITELGAVKLSPAGRELYFILYDLLIEDSAEKALERIDEWLRY